MKKFARPDEQMSDFGGGVTVFDSNVFCESATNLHTLRYPLHRQFLGLFLAVEKIKVELTSDKEDQQHRDREFGDVGGPVIVLAQHVAPLVEELRKALRLEPLR
jgi:hypothetical protein